MSNNIKDNLYGDSSGGTYTINGITEQYKVKNGSVIDATDFISFVTETTGGDVEKTTKDITKTNKYSITTDVTMPNTTYTEWTEANNSSLEEYSAVLAVEHYNGMWITLSNKSDMTYVQVYSSNKVSISSRYSTGLNSNCTASDEFPILMIKMNESAEYATFIIVSTHIGIISARPFRLSASGTITWQSSPNGTIVIESSNTPLSSRICGMRVTDSKLVIAYRYTNQTSALYLRLLDIDTYRSRRYTITSGILDLSVYGTNLFNIIKCEKYLGVVLASTTSSSDITGNKLLPFTVSGNTITISTPQELSYESRYSMDTGAASYKETSFNSMPNNASYYSAPIFYISSDNTYLPYRNSNIYIQMITNDGTLGSLYRLDYNTNMMYNNFLPIIIKINDTCAIVAYNLHDTQRDNYATSTVIKQLNITGTSILTSRTLLSGDYTYINASSQRFKVAGDYDIDNDRGIFTRPFYDRTTSMIKQFCYDVTVYTSTTANETVTESVESGEIIPTDSYITFAEKDSVVNFVLFRVNNNRCIITYYNYSKQRMCYRVCLLTNGVITRIGEEYFLKGSNCKAIIQMYNDDTIIIITKDIIDNCMYITTCTCTSVLLTIKNIQTTNILFDTNDVNEPTYDFSILKNNTSSLLVGFSNTKMYAIQITKDGIPYDEYAMLENTGNYRSPLIIPINDTTVYISSMPGGINYGFYTVSESSSELTELSTGHISTSTNYNYTSAAKLSDTTSILAYSTAGESFFQVLFHKSAEDVTASEIYSITIRESVLYSNIIRINDNNALYISTANNSNGEIYANIITVDNDGNVTIGDSYIISNTSYNSYTNGVMIDGYRMLLTFHEYSNTTTHLSRALVLTFNLATSSISIEPSTEDSFDGIAKIGGSGGDIVDVILPSIAE